MKKTVTFLPALAVLLLLPGCMGYRLGGGRPEGIQTVSMTPVINRTGEPAIEIQVTHALRERIQFDGRLSLVDDPGASDGVIEITLSGYRMDPISYKDEQRTTPDLYRLRITGSAVLRNAATGETVSTSETYGEATFTYQSDLTTAKRDALPAAAAEIAKYMVDDLIEQW